MDRDDRLEARHRFLRMLLAGSGGAVTPTLPAPMRPRPTELLRVEPLVSRTPPFSGVQGYSAPRRDC